MRLRRSWGLAASLCLCLCLLPAAAAAAATAASASASEVDATASPSPSPSPTRINNDACVSACESALDPVRFDDVPPDLSPPANRTCRSLHALASLYLCVEFYCEPAARAPWLARLNSTCRVRYAVAIPPFDLVANYTLDDIVALPRVNLSQSRSGSFGHVVLPSSHLWRVWWDTHDAVQYVQRYHLLYGGAMIVFWLLVVAVGIMCHAVEACASLHVVRRQSNKPMRKVRGFCSWAKAYISTPATFGDRCAQKIGWGTVPPRIQSLTLACFLVINVACSVHGYRLTPENFYFATVKRQVLRYVADRTGIISFANFPLIWLFGMRNNVLMWLTGWDFGTYNNFHRWVARIATLQAVIHSILYSVLVYDEGGWESYFGWWKLYFWWTGEVATIAMSLVVGLSFYWIRRQQYETFLVLHILISILVLLAMLGHVSIFSPMYDPLFWIPVYIWLGDRVLRALRILAFNPAFWKTWATAQYNPSSDIVRVTVPWASSLYKPSIGTFYYLHVLNGPRFWESHPFTVASVLDQEQPASKALGEQVPLLESDDEHGLGRPIDADADADHHLIDDAACSMTFLIRPYDGFTSRLRDVAEANGPRKTPIQVLIDGPYGHTQPLHTFDHVVFIVGGSGAVVALSYLHVLAGPNGPKSVQLHWAVREPAFALDVLRTDIGDTLGTANLSVGLYLTSRPRDADASGWPAQVAVHSGRIDAASVIHAARDKAPGDETIAIVACGPAQMADLARKTVASLVHAGDSSIQYFEESFQW